MTPPTKNRLPVTPGKAYVAKENGVGFGPIVSIEGKIMCHTVIWPGYDESQANATLYADAHNTFNTCHLLPSEMKAMLDEAIALLDKCEGWAWRCSDIDVSSSMQLAALKHAKEARAFLSRTQPTEQP